MKQNILRCVTTDGETMWRTEKHVVKQIYKPFKLVRCLLPVVIHCIIHQKIFCIKNLNLFCIIEPVVSIVNFIYSARLSQWVLYIFFQRNNILTCPMILKSDGLSAVKFYWDILSSISRLECFWMRNSTFSYYYWTLYVWKFVLALVI